MSNEASAPSVSPPCSVASTKVRHAVTTEGSAAALTRLSRTRKAIWGWWSFDVVRF